MAVSRVKEGWAGGEVLFVGGTDWAMLGRERGKGGKKAADSEAELARQTQYPNLLDPHRLKGLTGIKVMFVAAGCGAVHCIAGDAAGNCYTWGRNEKGQLGHGNLLQRNVPTIVAGLKGQEVVAGAAGKHHSVVVTKAGESYSWGLNTQGQCGTGSIKKASKGTADDVLTSPVKALVEGANTVSCGNDFTIWLCDGKLYAAGHPQFGQLGDGTDHEYNAKDSSVKLMYEPQPTPLLVSALSGARIVTHACGQTHTIAVDDAGAAYTWGNGNYGKLGHKVQQDEFAPRAIDTFKGRLTVPKDAVVSAGGTATFCTAVGGQLYGWGRLKQSGDNATYPQPVHDLSGWNVRSMACGPGHYAIAADTSVITWGHATNGELGYGAHGKKSSANPDKCAALDNLYTHQVACGAGFTLFLSDPDADGVKKLKVWEPAVDAEAAAAVAEEAGGGAKGAGAKRKAGAAGKAGGSKKKK